MQQKLVSVYLIDYTWDVDDEAQPRDTGTKEHLNEYFENGWRAVQVLPLSGTGGGRETVGWIVVVLEKD